MGQVLCNYALRREHAPVFVDLDPRYSNIRQLQASTGGPHLDHKAFSISHNEWMGCL